MKKKKLFGNTLKEQLLAGAEDRLYNFMLAEGMVRGAIIKCTKMINEMRANHELGILESLVLGHAYMGACLMASSLKGNDMISLQIDCSGPVKGLVVEANALGEVRGYLKNVPISIEKELEDFNLSPFFGAGFLAVTKHLEDAKQPFSGQVILEHGNIAQDLASYYLKSEQISTAFSLSIKFDSNGNITGAGGLFLQAMPEADMEKVAEIENLVQSFPSIGQAYADGKSPEGMINEVFHMYAPNFIADERIEFFCRCTEDRLKGYLKILPEKDLQDISINGPFPLELRCHYCNSLYHFQKEEVEQIYRDKKLLSNEGVLAQ